MTRSISMDDREHPRIIRFVVYSLNVWTLFDGCSSLGGDHTIVGSPEYGHVKTFLVETISSRCGRSFAL